ncbi:SDR family NAD(P)-dependent oxidoreductase [Candidatus Colwellia aromaticivorans]|uniref:SDR family NAD(P)-dependent oxidoreductase n=1 Tax=Candidatus Colwellia aromaticivorans TaxID=2267621 RepID=UPI000DF3E7CC|nr:SDR family NAD(P)-dependent oxidoreductase [Candidatus Colwellia aromaticivorans]
MTNSNHSQSNDLDTKLAIVTGGSSGIGAELAVSLAKAGWDVAITYAGNEQGAIEVTQAINETGQRSFYQRCDVGYSEQVNDFVAQVVQHFSIAPTLLVNNAGCQTWAPFLELKEEDWDKVIRTNLKGCFLFSQAVARVMVEHKSGGAIVNIGSGCNKAPFPNLVDYTASKGGMEMLTRSAAIELGKYGIRVNCVAPGGIEIARTREEAPDYAQTWGKVAPLGRVGFPDDIFNAVEFLATPASSFVTGQTIWVDGGVFTAPNWPYEQSYVVEN